MVLGPSTQNVGLATSIDSVVDNCLVKEEEEIDSIHMRVSEEMVEYFETSEGSETLAQWRKSTEMQLKNLYDEHKEEARKCNTASY